MKDITATQGGGMIHVSVPTMSTILKRLNAFALLLVHSLRRIAEETQ